MGNVNLFYYNIIEQSMRNIKLFYYIKFAESMVKVNLLLTIPRRFCCYFVVLVRAFLIYYGPVAAFLFGLLFSFMNEYLDESMVSIPPSIFGLRFWLLALSPVKKNNRCPRKSGLSILYLSSGKNDNHCHRKRGLSSLYLSLVKTIIGVPGKVVYLHYTTVYCACLSVLLIAFPFG